MILLKYQPSERQYMAWHCDLGSEPAGMQRQIYLFNLEDLFLNVTSQ